MKTKSLAINSILIAISASIIATILHELGHFATYRYFNLQPELHHNYVRCLINGADQQSIIGAAAGPLFSLVLGIVILFISIKFIKPSLFKLFVLWLGMENLITFLGYMLIAPIAKEGDTGAVFNYFGVPIYISIIIAIVSYVFIYYIFTKLATQFIYYKNNKTFDKAENLKQLFIYPILSSIVIITLLNLPVTTWVSLLPCIFIPMTYFCTMNGYKKLNISDAPVLVNKGSVIIAVLTIVSIIIFRYLV